MGNIFKTIKLPMTGSEDLILEFAKPSELLYSKIYQEYTQNDYYTCLDSILKNCLIESPEGIDLLKDEPLKMRIIGSVISEFFNFPKLGISDGYEGKKHLKLYNKLKENNSFIYCIDIEDMVFFLKPLERPQYRELFNLTVNSPKAALNYIYENLYLGGDDVRKDSFLMAACFSLADYILRLKESDLKKN